MSACVVRWPSAYLNVCMLRSRAGAKICESSLPTCQQQRRMGRECVCAYMSVESSVLCTVYLLSSSATHSTDFPSSPPYSEWTWKHKNVITCQMMRPPHRASPHTATDTTASCGTWADTIYYYSSLYTHDTLTWLTILQCQASSCKEHTTLRKAHVIAMLTATTTKTTKLSLFLPGARKEQMCLLRVYVACNWRGFWLDRLCLRFVCVGVPWWR